MKITLKNVRLFYAQNLFEAHVPPNAEATAKPKYGFEGTIERDSEEHKKLKAAVVQAATDEWKGTAPAVLKAVNAAGNIWCMRDGDTKVDKEGNPRPDYAGKIVVNAKNEIRPTLLAGGPDGRSPAVKEDGLLYSGCYVNLIIDVKAGSKPKKQVYAYLLGVQKAADGDRIGFGVASPEDFEPVASDNAGQTAEAKDLF